MAPPAIANCRRPGRDGATRPPTGKREPYAMDDLRRAFLDDAIGVAEAVRGRLAALPAGDSPDYEGLLTDIHTVKGSTSVLRLRAATDLAHSCETALERAASAGLDPFAAGALRRDLDRLVTELHGADRRETSGRVSGAAILPFPTHRAPDAWDAAEAVAHLGDLAHDLAAECGKNIVWSVDADRVALDGAAVAALVPGLVQLIRNAVAHGIETAEERRAAGKPAAGDIRLVIRGEERRLVAEVVDDGRGIDADRLAEAAVKAGLLTATEAAALGDEERAGLALRVGVSTAEPGLAAGRGVGFAVVETRLAAVGGSLAIDSRPGVGTSVTLMLPLRERADAVGDNFPIAAAGVIGATSR